MYSAPSARGGRAGGKEGEGQPAGSNKATRQQQCTQKRHPPPPAPTNTAIPTSTDYHAAVQKSQSTDGTHKFQTTPNDTTQTCFPAASRAEGPEVGPAPAAALIAEAGSAGFPSLAPPAPPFPSPGSVPPTPPATASSWQARQGKASSG